MEIYADNAATTKMSKKVIESMLPFFDKFYGNPSSIHSIGQTAKEYLFESRRSIAKCINCDVREIIFTSCGTEADNQAIFSAAKLGEKSHKKHIISSKIEHHAVLNTLKKLEDKGFEITLLDVDKNGIINLEELKNSIKENTCLVSIMYANNEIGSIQPIKEIGEICHNANIPFHTDAVQACGHLKIDVKEQNIDMLSISAHKFKGPKGIGMLYYKKGIQLESIITGGEQERGVRAGTENVASIIGMSVALEESCKNIDTNNKKLKRLQDRLISGLEKIPYSYLNGDRESRLTNNTNFCFAGVEGEALLLLLNEKGIYASTGSACASGSLNPSHVLLAIGVEKDLARSSLRITLSEDNTTEEVDYIIKSVEEIVTHLRNMSPIWQKMKEEIK